MFIETGLCYFYSVVIVTPVDRIFTWFTVLYHQPVHETFIIHPIVNMFSKWKT